MRYTLLGLAAFGALAAGGLMSATAPASAACFGIGPATICAPTRGGVAVNRGGAYMDLYEPRRHVKKRHGGRHVYRDRYHDDSYYYGDPIYRNGYYRNGSIGQAPGWGTSGAGYFAPPNPR